MGVPLDRIVDVRVGELARGMSAAARRLTPVRFWLTTAFGVVLVLAVSLWFVPLFVDGPSLPSLGAVFGIFFAGLYAAFVLPWTRYRLVALFLRATARAVFAPYRITTLSDASMRVESASGESVLQFATFDTRFETNESFVLGIAGQPICSVIPKRVFRDTRELESFRTAFHASTSEVATAIRAFSDDSAHDALRYTLEVREHRRGLRLLLNKSKQRFLVYGLLSFAAAFVAYECATAEDPVFVVMFMAIFLAVAIALGVRRGNARLRDLLTEMTFTFDEAGFRVEGVRGSLGADWTDTRGHTEDDLVFVIALQNDVGVILPKRSVPEASLEFVRSTQAAAGRRLA